MRYLFSNRSKIFQAILTSFEGDFVGTSVGFRGDWLGLDVGCSDVIVENRRNRQEK